jgi:hypothetical protein
MTSPVALYYMTTHFQTRCVEYISVLWSGLYLDGDGLCYTLFVYRYVCLLNEDPFEEENMFLFLWDFFISDFSTVCVLLSSYRHI